MGKCQSATLEDQKSAHAFNQPHTNVVIINNSKQQKAKPTENKDDNNSNNLLSLIFHGYCRQNYQHAIMPLDIINLLLQFYDPSGSIKSFESKVMINQNGNYHLIAVQLKE
eukprot:300245_1